MLQPTPDSLSLIIMASTIFLKVSRALHFDGKLVMGRPASAVSLAILGTKDLWVHFTNGFVAPHSVWTNGLLLLLHGLRVREGCSCDQSHCCDRADVVGTFFNNFNDSINPIILALESPRCHCEFK